MNEVHLLEAGIGGEKLALFAIGDLHLSFGSEKPMDIFGEHWVNHPKRVEEAWLEHIKDEDTILIPGDLSWGLRLDEAIPDLDWISQLPGKKIIIKGNHDYWWQTISKLNGLYPNIFFLQNTFFEYQDYAICGSRGWLCPNPTNFTEHDQKIYLREINRLKASLDQAIKNGNNKIIAMMHYPPTNEKYEASGFTELFEAYSVSVVVYGHLHGKSYYHTGLQGIRNGVEYRLVSCDYLEFKPLKILSDD